MRKLSGRQIAILNVLSGSMEPVTSGKLAMICGASDRTIRKDISQLRNLLEHYGVSILSTPGSGYQIDARDRGKISKLKHLLCRQSPHNSKEDTYRDHYIIQRLLSADMVRISDLAEELYIPEGTINRRLASVRRHFADYDLRIRNVQGLGLKAEGRGQYFLHCLIDEYDSYESLSGSIYECADFGRLFALEDPEEYLLINSQLKQHMEPKEGPDYQLMAGYERKLLYAIVLCFAREKRYYPDYTADEVFKLTSTRSNMWAGELLKELEIGLQTPYDKRFALWLGNIFLCYRSFISFSDVSVKGSYHEANTLIISALRQIGPKFGLEEIQYNRELIERLTCHLLNMQVRIQHHVLLSDFEMREFLRKSILSVELSIHMCSILSDHFKRDIHPNEVGYLAFAFVPYVLQLPAPLRKGQRIAVISGWLPREVASSIAWFSMQELEGFSGEIVAYEGDQDKRLYKEGPFDLIVTDMPEKFSEGYAGKVISYSFGATAQDARRFRQWYRCQDLIAESVLKLVDPKAVIIDSNTTNRSGALKEVARRITEYYQEDDAWRDRLYEDIQLRDKMYAAPLGDNVGMLRTMKRYGAEHRLFLFCFRHMISWADQNLRVLFVYVTGRAAEEHFRPVAHILECALGDGSFGLELANQTDVDGVIRALKSNLLAM